jgi:YD repeat-containing protein
VIVTVAGMASAASTYTVVTTTTVSGSVTRASDGSSVTGAIITAVQNGVAVATTTTAADGSYTIANLAAGNYDLTANANGFVPATKSRQFFSAGTSATVNIALFVPTIASLSPQSGVVGAKVTITGSAFGATQGSSIVSFNGSQAIATRWSDSSVDVSVPAAATSGLVTITVTGIASNGVSFGVGTGTVSGAITRQSDATAVSGAAVTLMQGGAIVASATSAADGSYSLGNVAPGTYDLKATATGLGASVATGLGVSSGATTTANVQLGSSITLIGSVQNSKSSAAITGATVTLSKNSEQLATATTDATGAYSIAVAGAGTYVLAASASQFNTASQSVTLTGTSGSADFTLVPAAPISYIYDEAGRLVGVIDQNGNSATYNYDAVGNVLSIARGTAAQPSLINFTPKSGPVGASVTIRGSGFSSTAASNTVTFAGTAATVTSASTTQLTVTVPTGALTGTIAVSTSAGSSSSSVPFTLTTTDGRPAISSFTPNIGLPGTAVSLSGTNFEPTSSNNVTRLNGNFAAASAATATSLTTAVPTTASSGPISVATPKGIATSAADFYVVPAGYTTATVGFTGRTTLGTASGVTLSGTNQAGLLLFDATAGQAVSIQVGTTTFTSFTVKILRPDGVALAGQCTAANCFMDAQTLQITGTYTILVTAAGAGTVNLTLLNATPVVKTITPGGAAVTVATTVAGQNANVTFSGAAGQRIAVLISGNTFGNCNVGVSLLNPFGATLVGGSCSTPSYFDTMILLTTGQYTLLINPNGTLTGSITLQVLNVPADVTKSIAIGGAPVTVTTVVGQNAALTFSGTAGQAIAVQMTANTYGNCNVSLNLVNPAGTTLTGGTCSTPSFFDTTVLATTGTYSLTINPVNNVAGAITMQVYSVPADATGTIAIDGPTVTLANTAVAQNASVTFTGTAGQRITIATTAPTASGNADLKLIDPAGTTLKSTTTSNLLGGWFTDVITLASTGTYTVTFNPQAAAIMSVNCTLTSVPVDATGTITIDGPAVTLANTAPAQNASLTFSGTAGQRIVITTSTPTTGGNTDLKLLDPAGATAKSATTSNLLGGWFTDVITLASTGTYTITFNPSGGTVMSISCTIRTVPVDATGTITIDGPAVTLANTAPAQNASLTFNGTAGQRIVITTSTPTTGGNTDLKLLDPVGATVKSATTSNLLGGWFTDVITLASSGTYTITFNPTGATVMSVSCTISTVPVDATGTITVNGPAVTLANTAPAQNASLTFTAIAGQRIAVKTTTPTTGGNTDLKLLDPAGATLNSATTSNLLGGWFTDVVTLASSGTYTITFNPTGATVMSVNATVTSVAADVSGTATINGSAVPLSITTPGQNASVSFANTAAQTYTVRITGNTIAGVTVTLKNPSGATVTSTSSSATSFNLSPPAAGSTATYTIVVDPPGIATGNISVAVTSP